MDQNDGCPFCGEPHPHEHIISNPMPPGTHPTYENLVSEVAYLRTLKSPPSMAEWCKEERAKGSGGCGACSICCGELREELERYENRPPTFAELSNMQDYNDDLLCEIEGLRQVIRLAYAWSKKPEHWQQARDALKNQMHAMGELDGVSD